jgi:hypothetical protein
MVQSWIFFGTKKHFYRFFCKIINKNAINDIYQLINCQIPVSKMIYHKLAARNGAHCPEIFTQIQHSLVNRLPG